MSHAEYFKSVKNIQLEHPKARPMIAVLGQRKQTIYLPAELVTGNELDPRVREQLPKIASFSPDVRTKAIENIKAFLTPRRSNDERCRWSSTSSWYNPRK
jgi:hypothetical protein